MELQQLDPAIITDDQLVRNMSQELNQLLSTRVRDEAVKAVKAKEKAQVDYQKSRAGLLDFLVILCIMGILIGLGFRMYLSVVDDADQLVLKDHARQGYIKEHNKLADQLSSAQAANNTEKVAQLDQKIQKFDLSYNNYRKSADKVIKSDLSSEKKVQSLKKLEKNLLSFDSKSPTKTNTTHVTEIKKSSNNLVKYFLYLLGAICLAAIGAITYFGQKMYRLRKTITRNEYQEQKDILAKVTTDLVAYEAQAKTLQALQDLYQMHKHVEHNPGAWQHFTQDLSGLYAETVLAGHLVKKIDDYVTTRPADASNRQLVLNNGLSHDKQTLLEHVSTMAENISLLRGEILRMETSAFKKKLNSNAVNGLVITARANHTAIKEANILTGRQLEPASAIVSADSEPQQLATN